tara:strand:+ start:504 stop:1736 length:1233 start_codon:yes stop_codon:yes gene_type:complete
MEKELIPQLRFPEFNEKWDYEQLDWHIDLISGYAFKGDDISDNSTGVPLLRGINITEGFIRHNSDIDRFYNDSIEKLKKYFLKENDLVLGMDGSKVGKNVALIRKEDENSLLIQRVARLRAKKTSDIRYIYLNIFSSRFHRYVDMVNTSSGIPHISSKQIKEFQIGFPTLPEQQKIASFLSDVDDKITKLTNKKTLLEEYKKGIMQKIFSQELRFKDDDGNQFPKWEVKKLGSIGSIVSGLTYSPNDINKKGVLVLRSSNVKKRLISLNDNVFVNVEEGKYNPVELNDILICVRNGSKRLIGKNAIIKEEHIGLAFGAFMTVYRSNYNRFLFHFFDSQHYKKEVHKNLGATINSINGGDLKKFKVPFPCEEEQTKIANFLSDIDLKIEALGAKIENSKAFKKGLLQQMFV